MIKFIAELNLLRQACPSISGGWWSLFAVTSQFSVFFVNRIIIMCSVGKFDLIIINIMKIICNTRFRL